MTSSSTDITRLTAEELAEKLSLGDSSSSTPTKLAIIDVRSTDFPGGHIPTATNIPCGEDWESDEFVDEILSKFADEDLIVCHCMLSQQRGPYCASRLNERIKNLDKDKKPQMCVLISLLISKISIT
jgi:Cdc25 family phosphatase